MRAAGRRRAAVVLLFVVVLGVNVVATSATIAVEQWDHTTTELLQGPFADGPDVTQACITCHADVAADVLATVHWSWEYADPVTGALLGKRHVFDNTWIALRGNEARCTSCHIGYGWDDDRFDFSEASAIDCLVCHDTTGTYAKFPSGAGHPVTGEPQTFDGVVFEPVDLSFVARNVGIPGPGNCTACHVAGGGGDGINHAEPVGTAVSPTDIHMDPDGLDFDCQTCHVTDRHEIPGGRQIADWVSGGPAACERCHSPEPHTEPMLNEHVATVACQTCHIPSAGSDPVAISWDWSVAGAADPNGDRPHVIVDEAVGRPAYDSRFGSIMWGTGVTPVYRYANGTYDWFRPDEPVDPAERLVVNAVLGSPADGRIWPFQVFAGVQPYDPASGLLAPIDLFPSDDEDFAAFWRSWDLEGAIAAGFAAYGRGFSGEVAFIESTSYRPITHGVAPAADALGCNECHAAEGRLDYTALGYAAIRATALSEPKELPEPPPPTTTTTSSPPVTAPAPSTTIAPTTTTLAAAASTSIAAAGADDDDSGFSVAFIAAVASAVTAAGAAVGFGVWVSQRSQRRRTPPQIHQ